MSHDQSHFSIASTMEAELERLRAENEQLKKKSPGITIKTAPKGGVSVYGLGRFPVTLYKNQWMALLDRSQDILDYIEEHDDELSSK